MKKLRRGRIRYNVLHDNMVIPSLPNNTIRNMKQKKNISYNLVDQATGEKAPYPTN